MRRFRLRALALGSLIVLVAASPALAGDATTRIRAFFASVNRVIGDASYDDRPAERLAALRAMVVEMVDFDQAAQVALGPEWRVRTAAEREEFVRLFADLLQTSVFAMVGGRARIDNGLTVTYVGELDDADGVTVATSVLTRSGAEMGVGYRMAQRNGRWLVRDVVVDGVSLVDNYRAQFQKVMQRSSYAGLVSEMRTRIAELGHPAATAMTAPAPPPTVLAATPAPASAPSPALAQALPTTPPPAPSSPRENASTLAAAPVAQSAPATGAEMRPVNAPPTRTSGATIAARAAVPAPLAPITSAAESPAGATPNEAPRASASSALPSSSETTARVAQVRVVGPTPSRALGAPAATFWVQLGAFKEIDRAMQVVTTLRDEAVSMVSAPGAPLIRVLVGPFANRAAATAKLRDLRRRGYEAFIAEATK